MKFYYPFISFPLVQIALLQLLNSVSPLSQFESLSFVYVKSSVPAQTAVLSSELTTIELSVASTKI